MVKTAPADIDRPALSVDEALARILERFSPLQAENRDLQDCLGYVLAEDVGAPNDVPPFANSAMDGFAVRSEDVRAATQERPVVLPVSRRIAAGDAADEPLLPGTAARIMTGAPLPRAADAVVRFEDTDSGEDSVAIRRVVQRHENVRLAGEDVRRGDVVARTGTLLRPAEIGVLASAGRPRVSVFRRPRVAVLSTGDELVEIDESPGPGKIRDANRHSLSAAARAAGAVVVPIGIVRDRADDLRAALRRASAEDVIVTSGGVSVGDFDLVKLVMSEFGAMNFWLVSMRPGKPLAFGDVRGTPIFGLPGNPVSSLMTFELFVRPALLRMQGRSRLHRPRATATLIEDVPKPPHLRYFARAVYEPAARTVRTTGPQGSGILQSMALANCLLDLPIGPDLVSAGSEVTVILTDQPEDH